MKTNTNYSLKGRMATVLVILAVTFINFSCAEEDIVLADAPNIESPDLSTPEIDNFYTLTNKKSGLTLDISSGNNSTGATHRQWAAINTVMYNAKV